MEFTDFGRCERCDQPATFLVQAGNVITERLCGGHRVRDIKQDTLQCYTGQQAERESLSIKYHGRAIVLSVHDNKNLDGEYVASVENPINSCPPGFGSTPARALRELGKHVADDADFILTKIKEHEFEIRQLQAELGEEQ